MTRFASVSLIGLPLVAALLVVSAAAGVAGQQQLQQQTSLPANQSKPDYLETGRQITNILDRFMALGYDKRVRPNYGGPPVEVNVTMRILSISSVSEVMMDFTADFYFRQTWHDARLAFRKLAQVQTLYVGAEVSKKIWLPDTFFGNEKMAYFHEATTPNVFLRIDHSGEVYRSIRLTVTSSCPMKLQYFPMDQQRCTIEAESYGYNVKDIKYVWAHDKAVERDKDISLPQFDIVTISQKYRLEVLTSGTYSRLIAEIHFVRRMGYYLIQIYVPSSLTVIISWVSFWLHRNASPARVQLGVTTVLTMTTLMSSTKSSLPKVSYVKSIDIFLGTCFVMVFAALLEYATVGYLGKRIAMRKSQLQQAQARAQARLFARLRQGQDTTTSVSAPPEPASESYLQAQGLSLAGYIPGCGAPSSGRPSSTEANMEHAGLLVADLTCNPSPPPLISGRATTTKPQQPVAPERAHTCHWLANQTLLGHSTLLLSAPQQPTQQQRRNLIGQHWPVLDQCAGCNNNAPKLGPTAAAAAVRWLTSEELRTGDAAAAAASGACLKRGHRRRAVEAATAAAAASFVNSHRRHRGLGPSTDPCLGPYAHTEPHKARQIDTIFRVRPSDIDKYSRVVFPVCFVCFQLMYWLVYLHISTFDDLNPAAELGQQQ